MRNKHIHKKGVESYGIDKSCDIKKGSHTATNFYKNIIYEKVQANFEKMEV